jgi:hypothetical protein
MSVAVAAAVVLIAAVIQRGGPKDQRERMFVLCVAVAVMCVAFFAVCYAAAANRGYSISSSAVIALGALYPGVGVILVIPRFPSTRVVFEGVDGIFVGPPRMRDGEIGHRVLLWAWLIGAVVLSLIPFRFMGALNHHPVLTELSGIVSGGHFSSIAELRTIGVGDCLEARQPTAVADLVVPCPALHRAQVVATEDPSTPCPQSVDYDDPGLKLELRSVVVGTVKFCVLVSGSLTRSWTGQLGPALPHTL